MKGSALKATPTPNCPGMPMLCSLKEFQGDKAAKEEAQQLAQTKLRKDVAVVLDADDSKKSSGKKEDEGNDILIKNISVADLLKEEKPAKRNCKS